MTQSSSRSGNRLLLILTGAAVAAAAGYCFYMNSPGLGQPRQKESAAVFGGWTYDREDQHLAAAALVKAGLTDYTWEDGRLLVPAARRGEYERVLGEGSAMPKKPSALKQEDLNGLSLFESENRTKMRDLYSSARQLEKTLESFRQIESASVGPHARREQAGLYPKTVVTASISVTPKEGCAVTPELISSITMAARHHLGITDNGDVSIIDTESGRSWLGSEGAVTQTDGSSMAAEKTRLEDLWTGKLREALGYIPNIRIATSVELEEVENEAKTARADDATRRPIGLEFTDAAPAPARVISYQPRMIAASIAVPESYVRRALDSDAAAPGADAGDFKAKKDLLLAQVRETAETMMNPAGTETGPNRRVEVSLYTDLSGEERVYRPVPEAADEQITLLSDPSAADPDTHFGGKAESAAQLARRMMSAPWAGYILACLAFAAGLVIRSIFTSRRADEANTEANTAGETAEAIDTARTARPAQATPRMEIPQPKETRAEDFRPKEARAESAAADGDRNPIDTARLNRILDELENEDLSSETADADLADEMIAPAGGTKEIPSFFTAEDEEGALKDFRIDPSRGTSDGPHFAVRETAGEYFGDAPPAAERFSFLADLETDELRALIDKQRPQTVALIARYAPPECRTRILNMLRSRLRDEVERRMRSSDEPDPKVVAAVEASLRSSLGAAGGTSA